MQGGTQAHSRGIGELLNEAEIKLLNDAEIKPLLRGWSHALAAVAATVFSILLCLRGRSDLARFSAVAVFSLSTIGLYGVSALYHIGTWPLRVRRRLRMLDHANIYLQIAGTYTPFCVIVLSGWLRLAMLGAIWLSALAGIAAASRLIRSSAWIKVAVYLGMGWVSVVVSPVLWRELSWTGCSFLALGGVLYSLGACVYAWRRPNPFPRVFGYHEVFHLLVIAGWSIFAWLIWVWIAWPPT